MNKLSAVFFDLDGTLLDTATDLLVAFNYTLEKYNFSPISEQELIPHISNGSRKIIQNLVNQQVSEELLDKISTEFITAYHKLGHTHTDFFPGMLKVIEIINSKNIKWGIITNKTEKLTLPIIDKLNIYDLKCQTVICADTTAHKKPHPEPMLRACKDLNVNPEDCMFIGDALTDIEAGNNVGMQTVLASYGYIHDKKSIGDWGADYIINSIMELEKII